MLKGVQLYEQFMAWRADENPSPVEIAVHGQRLVEWLVREAKQLKKQPPPLMDVREKLAEYEEMLARVQSIVAEAKADAEAAAADA